MGNSQRLTLEFPGTENIKFMWITFLSSTNLSLKTTTNNSKRKIATLNNHN